MLRKPLNVTLEENIITYMYEYYQNSSLVINIIDKSKSFIAKYIYSYIIFIYVHYLSVSHVLDYLS